MNDLFGGAPLSAALGLLALAALPLALMTVTSFAKIAIVFSVLRNALGTPDVPSGVIITAVALALSVFVMAPVASDVQERLSESSRAPSIEGVMDAASAPARAFLAKHAGERETAMLLELGKDRQPKAEASDLSVLWPSFALSELRRAFHIGFLVFLPFLVLDLVVANILLALGLHGLTPSAVALPFKLLLFVSVDGWVLLSRALMLGYT
jgi:type III secretion protein R